MPHLASVFFVVSHVLAFAHTSQQPVSPRRHVLSVDPDGNVEHVAPDDARWHRRYDTLVRNHGVVPVSKSETQSIVQLEVESSRLLQNTQLVGKHLAWHGISRVNGKPINPAIVAAIIGAFVLSALVLFFVCPSKKKEKRANLKATFDNSVHEVLAVKESYDFEVPDPRGRLNLYKWCTEEECTRLGIKTKGSSHGFGDYVILDFDKSARSVLDLLRRYNYLGDDRSMDSMFLRLARQEVALMTKTDDTGLFLLQEQILLRFSCGSHLLVMYVSSGSADKFYLPYGAKMYAESPQSAAERLWVRGLGIPTQRVRFVVHGVEQTEKKLPQYNGMRSIRRTHIVLAALANEDPAVVQALGVPAEPTATRTRAPSEEYRLKLEKFPEYSHLEWLPLSEIQRPEVKISEQVAFDRPNLFLGPIDELNAFLKQGSLEIEAWTGSGKTKTLADLRNEVEEGDCTLRADGAARPLTIKREVTAIALRLRLPNDADSRLLVNTGRKDRTGDIIWNARLPGRLQRAGEDVEDAARSVCTGNLGLSDDVIELPSEASRDYSTYDEASNSYPGLITTYHRLLVDVLLSAEAHIVPDDFVPLDSDCDSEEVPDNDAELSTSLLSPTRKNVHGGRAQRWESTCEEKVVEDSRV